MCAPPGRAETHPPWAATAPPATTDITIANVAPANAASFPPHRRHHHAFHHYQHCRLFHVKHPDLAEHPLFHVKQRVFSRLAASVSHPLSKKWACAATRQRRRQQRAQQPTSFAPRPGHKKVFTFKERHQRGRARSASEAPTEHSATDQPRLATRIRRSLHQRGALTYEKHPPAGGFTNKGHPPANTLRHRPRQLRAVDTPRGSPRLAARARASAPWRGAKTQARAKKPMSTKTIVAPVGTSMDHER